MAAIKLFFRPIFSFSNLDISRAITPVPQQILSGNGYYRVSSKTVPTWLFALLLASTHIMQIAKVGTVLKNSGNLLCDRHKNFENRFRNS